MVDAGSMHAMHDQTNNVPLPPIAGAAALIGGVVLGGGQEKLTPRRARRRHSIGTRPTDPPPRPSYLTTRNPRYRTSGSKSLSLCSNSHPALDASRGNQRVDCFADTDTVTPPGRPEARSSYAAPVPRDPPPGRGLRHVVTMPTKPFRMRLALLRARTLRGASLRRGPVRLRLRSRTAARCTAAQSRRQKRYPCRPPEFRRVSPGVRIDCLLVTPPHGASPDRGGVLDALQRMHSSGFFEQLPDAMLLAQAGADLSPSSIPSHRIGPRRRRARPPDAAGRGQHSPRRRPAGLTKRCRPAPHRVRRAQLWRHDRRRCRRRRPALSRRRV